MPITVTPVIPQTTVTPPNPLEEEAAVQYLLSFNGRVGNSVGNVAPASGDYKASQVTDDSTVTGGSVAAALNTLNTTKQDIPAEGEFEDGDKTKLDGIEAGAQVNNISDENATYLTDSGETSLHTHPASTPAAHAASHTDGTDDIQNATAAQKGLATATQITKLDGIEAGAKAGDVVGPASATADNLAVFDSTSGKLIKDGTKTVAQVLARANHTGVQLATTVEMDELGTATYDDVQDWSNSVQSAGIIAGGDLTDGGSGTIDISTVLGIVKTTDSAIGVNKFFDLAGVTGQALTDNSTNFISVDYNSGTPQFLIGVTNTANGHTIFNLGKVYREGTNIDIIDSGLHVSDMMKRIQQHHVDESGLHFVSGAVVSEVGTRELAITAGIMYAGLNRIVTDAIDTDTGGDTFEYYYYNGSAWVESDQTTIDNLQYNNVASGLVELSNNKYGVHWVYKGTNSTTYVLYGQGDYTLSEAQSALPPALTPDHVSEFGVIRVKIIILKSATSFLEIDQINDGASAAGSPSNHNELGGLQGGAAAEYYHLSATRYKNMWIPAGAFAPRTTNGAAADTEEYATNDVILDEYLFDGATEEAVSAQIAFPDEWDLGTIKAKVYWDAATGATASDGVVWGIRGRSIRNDDAIDAALGTEVNTTDAVIAVGDMHISPATAAITLGGTIALGNLALLQVARKVGEAADDMTEDAKFFGVMIQYKELTTAPVIW